MAMMGPYVSPQVGRGYELPLTDGTGVGLHTCVRQYVGLEVSARCERFTARVALVRFFARVNADVAAEVTR